MERIRRSKFQLKRSKYSINSIPWINSKIIHAIKEKVNERRKLKSSPSDALQSKFKEFYSREKHLVSHYRAHFFETLDVDLHNNPKRFWSLLKLKTKDSTVPRNVPMEASESATCSLSVLPRDIAELFTDYFASVLNKGNQVRPVHLPFPPPPCVNLRCRS